MRPIAIDLFAGAGGLSLGVEQAGFDVVAAVEIDPVHACIHKFNFPNCRVIPISVSELKGLHVRKLAGLSTESVIDLVVGGAPCQGFSVIGQRALDDPRNSLVKDFIRLVYELSPSYFMFENVKGLAIGDHRKLLEEIISEASNSGYEVLPPEILNAKDFGVPQSRERLFIVGAKQGCKYPSIPKPIGRGVTCWDALDDLPDVDNCQQSVSSNGSQIRYLREAKGYSAMMRCLTEDSWKFGYKRIWDPTVLTNSCCTQHSEASRYRFSRTKPGTREPVSRFFRLSPDSVCTTLRAGTDSAHGSFTSPRPIHYKYDRCVTIREMARLHGFPDWFRFHATKWHGARQVGNSVPPPLAFAIAREIFKCLPYQSSCPPTPVPLGDSALLNMTMTAASRYWGVKNPIAKRNQKSGRRKRKQSEMEVLMR